MSRASTNNLTVAEYLALERKASFKSEYFQGEAFAMAGGTSEHSLIATNFTGEARSRLKNKPCVVFNSDLRVKVASTGLYTYPDASIVCGQLQFDDQQKDTLINPTVLVEVLSESTQSYDRGIKSRHYRKIDSLQELLLISQDSPTIEYYIRSPAGDWLFRESESLEATLRLASIGIDIPVAEIYRGVTLPPMKFSATQPN
jgi:Uma2 family endonuclease